MILKALTPCFALDAMYKEIRRCGACVALMNNMESGVRCIPLIVLSPNAP
jgi:hypothetical protein